MPLTGANVVPSNRNSCVGLTPGCCDVQVSPLGQFAFTTHRRPLPPPLELVHVKNGDSGRQLVWHGPKSPPKAVQACGSPGVHPRYDPKNVFAQYAVPQMPPPGHGAPGRPSVATSFGQYGTGGAHAAGIASS